MVRRIDLSLRLLVEAVLSYVTNHTHDGEPWGWLAVRARRACSTHANALADWIVVRPPAPDKGLIHDRDRHAGVIIRFCKCSAGQQRDLHRLEIGWTDIVNISVGEFSQLRCGAILNAIIGLPSLASERQWSDCSH